MTYNVNIKRMLSVLLAVVMAAGCLAGLSACGDSGNYPVTVAGVLIEKRPEKIVCLANEYTQIIADLGYIPLMSGCSGDCTVAEAKDLEPCGTADAPSTDVILSLGTDLLICDLNTPTEPLEELEKAGVTILQLIPPATRTAFSNLYRCIGAAVNGAVDGYRDGNDAAQKILVQMDDVERLVMGRTRVNVCIFTNSSLNEGVTGDMLGTVAIELAGGFNIAVEATGGYLDLETMARLDPDVILCAAGTENVVRSKRELEDSGAIRDNRVYAYDISKFSKYGNDLVLATWELARLFNPDIVTADMLPVGATDYLPNFDGSVLMPDEYEAEQSSIAASIAAEPSTTKPADH